MYPYPLIKIKDDLGNIKWQGIYLYGVCIAIGLIACMLVLFYYTKKKGMPSQLQDYVYVVGAIAVVFGFLAAKVYQAVYVWVDTGVFDFYNAGITAMGGFIGGAAAFIGVYFLGGKFVFKGKKEGLHKKHFNTLVLVAPICITIAHAFGRLGCLFGGCCHGTYLGSEPVTGGIYMLGSVNGHSKWGYYIPAQLYEALFLFALFGVLTLLYFKGSNLTMPIYLISYAVWRMIIEFFRGDAARVENLAAGLTPSQWQSVAFFLGGIAIIIVYKILKIPFKLKQEISTTEESETSTSAEQ